MHVLVGFKMAPAKARRCWTPSAVNTFVDRAVEITGLTPFGERQVVDHDGVLMFFQFIAESHIAGHLDPRRGRGWVDVFSCRFVPADLVAAAVYQHLAPGTTTISKVEALDRGILP